MCKINIKKFLDGRRKKIIYSLECFTKMIKNGMCLYYSDTPKMTFIKHWQEQKHN